MITVYLVGAAVSFVISMCMGEETLTVTLIASVVAALLWPVAAVALAGLALHRFLLGAAMRGVTR